MPFIGNQPALSYTSFAKQDFTTSATTSYTLDQPVANENEIALFINFVRQEPTTAYTASGTTLTLTSATSASDDMYCVFLGKAVQTVNPPNSSVGISQLSATGTKDATTFLRGDNTFAEAGGGKVLQVVTATDSTQRTTTSTSFVTASNTLSLSITPSATSSKIFIIASSSGQNNTANGYAYYTLFKDSTNLGDSTSGMTVVQQESGSNNNKFSIGMSYLDSPSSTSALTYAVYMKVNTGTGVLNSEGVQGSITAFEVGA